MTEAEVWRCVACNRKLPYKPEPTLSPDYGRATCPTCHKMRPFKRAAR